MSREHLTDGAALTALLAANGVGEAERVAAAAQLALQLVPPGAGAAAARSRLGGPALLPPGHEWPRDRRGRPLTFLAGLDLGELPAFDGRDDLPADGWLLAFADIANEDAEGLIDESGSGDGDLARLLFTREPVEAHEPEDLLADANNVLRRRPVVARPALTIADDYDAPERLGIGEDDLEQAWEVLAGWYGEGTDDEVRDDDRDQDIDDLWTGPEDTPRTEEALVAKGWRPPDDGRSLGGMHWVGGAASGVQGHPPEPGTMLVLHLGWDEPLGFLFLDGGALQFRIDPAAARAGEWSRAIALTDSA